MVCIVPSDAATQDCAAEQDSSRAQRVYGVNSILVASISERLKGKPSNVLSLRLFPAQTSGKKDYYFGRNP
jgi:hypothetical protein